MSRIRLRSYCMISIPHIMYFYRIDTSPTQMSSDCISDF